MEQQVNGGIKNERNSEIFNNLKGFGFITAEDEKDYYVHQTGLKEGVALHDNDTVTFDVAQGEKDPKAVNVEKSG